MKVDLSKVNAMSIAKEIRVSVTKKGRFNSLRLTSHICLYKDIKFYTSDSLFPPVVIPLKQDISVRTGDIVDVRIPYKNDTDWNYVQATAKIVR